MSDQRIDEKLDMIVEKISSIDSTLASQHEILKDHTRRSLANEEAVKLLGNELKPVLSHVAIVDFIGKVCALILGSDLLYGLIKRLFKLQ